MMIASLLLALLATVDAGMNPTSAANTVDAGAPLAPMVQKTTTAIAGITTQQPVVALTFDACATKKQANGFDRPIFDLLSKEKIPATFYLSGRWVEKHPRAAEGIAAADFIELGNHSYTHPRLTLLRPERLRAQIRRTNNILEKRLGRPALSLRPPAGAWDENVVRAADEEHLPVVLWTVVSGDAGGHIPAARIRDTVLAQAKPGAIIIFHINKRAPFTKKALPDIIQGLREKGFHFVTVSQLLALPDAVPIPAKPSRLGYHKLRPRKAPVPVEENHGENPEGVPEANPQDQHDGANIDSHIDPHDNVAPGVLAHPPT